MGTTTWLKDENKNVDWLKGGLEESDRDYLRSLARSVIRPGMIGFDIGCFTGWTGLQVAPIFAENGGRFYLADWFRGSIDTVVAGHWWGSYPSDQVLLSTLNNVEAMGLHDCVSVLVTTTDNLGKIVADGVADYIYIGADHRYTPFKRDIETWLPKLRPGGILCGHAFDKPIEIGSPEWNGLCEAPEQDYDHSNHVHFGVTRAVQELLPEYERGGQQIWAYRKPL